MIQLKNRNIHVFKIQCLCANLILNFWDSYSQNVSIWFDSSVIYVEINACHKQLQFFLVAMSHMYNACYSNGNVACVYKFREIEKLFYVLSTQWYTQWAQYLCSCTG